MSPVGLKRRVELATIAAAIVAVLPSTAAATLESPSATSYDTTSQRASDEAATEPGHTHGSTGAASTTYRGALLTAFDTAGGYYGADRILLTCIEALGLHCPPPG